MAVRRKSPNCVPRRARFHAKAALAQAFAMGSPDQRSLDPAYIRATPYPRPPARSSALSRMRYSTSSS